jgi:hypothetical protein
MDSIGSGKQNAPLLRDLKFSHQWCALSNIQFSSASILGFRRKRAGVGRFCRTVALLESRYPGNSLGTI